jgi:hypothetical protein
VRLAGVVPRGLRCRLGLCRPLWVEEWRNVQARHPVTDEMETFRVIVRRCPEPGCQRWVEDWAESKRRADGS